MKWQDDSRVIANLTKMRNQGFSWSALMDAIAKAGFPRPSDVRSFRRQFPIVAERHGQTVIPVPGGTPPSLKPPVIDEAPAASTDADDNEEMTKFSTRIASARLTNARAKYEASSIIKEAKNEAERLAKRESELISLAAATARPTQFPQRPPIPFTRTSEQDIVVIVADAHFGKKVDAGVNSDTIVYNKNIALDYLHVLETNIYDIASHTSGVRNCHFLFVGDNEDGDFMRDGHPFRIDMTIGEQQLFASDNFTGLMLSARQMGFKDIFGRAVPGNHGRLGKHLDDRPLTDNHEWVMYQIMKRQLDRYDIPLHVSQRESDSFTLGGLRYYMEHGHRCQGGRTGSPVTAVKNRLNKLRQSLVKETIDVAVFAHFHQAYIHDIGDGSLVVGSGCWDGGDDYSCNSLGAASGGSQWILAQSPEIGITDFHQVFFSGRRPGIAFPDAAERGA